MTDDLLRLHDLIQERTGLDLRRGPDEDSFAQRIARPLEKSGCGSLADYFDRLQAAESGSEDWNDIIAAFSRPASSFWRHQRHTRILSDTLIPRLMNTDRDRVRIWSAGCSTGEEPLMIAMTLAEAGWFDRGSIDIAATDANAHSITHARRGIYTEQRVNGLPSDLKTKYFTRVGLGWAADAELRARIEWSVASLVNENQIAGSAASDVIFCRNVFLYFSDRAIERTLRIFHRYMPEGGYLITDEGDHYERLISDLGIFEEERFEGIIVRKKIELHRQ